MAGCCGPGVGVGGGGTVEICGTLSAYSPLPGGCADPGQTDRIVVLRGGTCYTLDACKVAPRYMLVA